MTPAGVITQWMLADSPRGVAVGPDHNLWVTGSLGFIYRVTPKGVVTKFSSAETAAAQPAYIVAGPDGNMWFTGPGSAAVYRITMNGAITKFPSANPASQPIGIAVGPDGALWITDFNLGAVIRMTVQGKSTVVASGLPGPPVGITRGPDGSMWVAVFNNEILRLRLDGTYTAFPASSGGVMPFGITTGLDGALWYGDAAGSGIWRITTDGTTTQYPTSTEVHNVDVAPNGVIWGGGITGPVRMTSGLAGAPRTVKATAGKASAKVTWLVPADSGMNDITSYKVSATPGGAGCITAAMSCTVKGLKKGHAYRFSVRAANSLGYSPNVGSSAAVTIK